MGHLWDIAQAHIDEYGVRAAALARRMGTSPQTLDSWKNRGVRSLPSKALLEALAEATHTPYEVVLDAALRDIDYLPRAGEGSAEQPAPMNEGPDGPASVTDLFPPDVPQAPPQRAAARKRPKPLPE